LIKFVAFWAAFGFDKEFSRSSNELMTEPPVCSANMNPQKLLIHRQRQHGFDRFFIA
jgi:hypothetical protein